MVPLVVRRSMANTTLCGPGGEEHFIPQGTSVYLMIKASHTPVSWCDLAADDSREAQGRGWRVGDADECDEPK